MDELNKLLSTIHIRICINNTTKGYYKEAAYKELNELLKIIEDSENEKKQKIENS